MRKTSVIFCFQPRWFSSEQNCKAFLSNNVRSWLYEKSSLTQRLKNSCGSDFGVSVLHQVLSKPYIDESRVLNLSSNRYALVREVVLHSGHNPLIIARTVIPLKTLRGAQRRLSSLGSRPLGEVIFTYPGLQRLNLDIVEVSKQTWNPALIEKIKISEPVWGRRTLYGIGGRHLLVGEFFLPAVLALR